ncbi:MAG: hypothetical protein ACREP9_15850, partial [Candidatus Dormibacteraceae bacterium]
MWKSLTWGGVPCLWLVLVSCARSSPSPSATETSRVLDALKDDLALVASTMPSRELGPEAVCHSPKGAGITLIPDTATVSLNVVASNVVGLDGHISVPVGSVLTVDSQASRELTQVATQQMTLVVKIAHRRSSDELRAELEKLQRDADLDAKVFAGLGLSRSTVPGDEIIASNFLELQAKRRASIRADFASLASGNGITLSAAYGVYDDKTFAAHPLADALYRLRESLIAVDHSKEPCLELDSLTARMDFEAKTRASSDGKIELEAASLGGQSERTRDWTQSLIVTFTFAAGSFAINLLDPNKPANG